MLISLDFMKNLTTDMHKGHANSAEDIIQIRWRVFIKLLEELSRGHTQMVSLYFWTIGCVWMGLYASCDPESRVNVCF